MDMPPVANQYSKVDRATALSDCKIRLKHPTNNHIARFNLLLPGVPQHYTLRWRQDMAELRVRVADVHQTDRLRATSADAKPPNAKPPSGL